MVIAFWDFEVVVMSYLGPGMVVIAFLDFEVVVMSYCPDEMVVIAFPRNNDDHFSTVISIIISKAFF